MHIVVIALTFTNTGGELSGVSTQAMGDCFQIYTTTTTI